MLIKINGAEHDLSGDIKEIKTYITLQTQASQNKTSVCFSAPLTSSSIANIFLAVFPWNTKKGVYLYRLKYLTLDDQ